MIESRSSNVERRGTVGEPLGTGGLGPLTVGFLYTLACIPIVKLGKYVQTGRPQGDQCIVDLRLPVSPQGV